MILLSVWGDGDILTSIPFGVSFPDGGTDLPGGVLEEAADMCAEGVTEVSGVQHLRESTDWCSPN